MPFEVQGFLNLEETMQWMGVGRRHDGREDDRGQLNAHAAQALKRKGCRYGQVDAFIFMGTIRTPFVLSPRLIECQGLNLRAILWLLRNRKIV